MFEKDKLNGVLAEVLAHKPDITWIALAMASVSSSIVLLTYIDKINTLNASKSAIPLSVLLSTFAISLLCLISIVWFSISISRWLKNRKYTLDELKRDVYASEIAHEHNYVFIIKTTIDNAPKLLFLRKPKWGYMLPYIKHDSKIEKTEIESRLKGMLQGVNINVKVMDGAHLNNVIKRKPDEGYTKFSYTFCQCELFVDYHRFLKLLANSSDPNKYSFISINELREDLSTMKSNSDIVNYIEEERMFDFDDSFECKKASSIPKNLKVIWNITDQCSFDCDFCATKCNTAEENELSFDARIKIAEELKAIEGLRLDFAGGDPLYDKNSRRAIEHISKYMIKSDVTVTSTGVGLSNIDTAELYKYCKEFDISYDYPSTWSNAHRGEKYNERNFEQIRTMVNSGAKVNILVTLSNHNTSNPVISAMVRELRTVNPHSITLLRLMPVGKQLYSEYPDVSEYNPTEAITIFKKEFGDMVKLHCAFRAHLKGEHNFCNLIKEKIGVDNLGNVYACAWTGYLQEKGVDNPFYFGNLINTDIETIFKSKRYGEIRSMLDSCDNKHCRIFSFLGGGASGLCKNSDEYIGKYKVDDA